MLTAKISSILEQLESDILSQEYSQLLPIATDRWLLSSILQKSIRRGNTELAMRAAASLIHTDKRSFWNRLVLIAAEDIGCGNSDVIAKVLVAASSAGFKKRVGELETGLHLTRLLCEAVKSRLADYIFIMAERSKVYSETRGKLSVANDTKLTDFIINIDNDLVERALALWFLFGSQKFPSEFLPKRIGSPEKAISVLRSLNTPATLTDACVDAIKSNRWPLTVFLPLIWQEVGKEKTTVRYNSLPVMAEIHGIPDICADQFTRIGLASFRELQKTVPCLREFTEKQVALSGFYLQSALVDKELTSPRLELIKAAGELADIETLGLDEQRYKALRDCLSENLGELAAIRKEKLQQYRMVAA